MRYHSNIRIKLYLYAAICVFFFIHGPARSAASFGIEAGIEPYILFANVGQGDCQLIQCSNQYFVLIDCGSTSKPEMEDGSSSEGVKTKDFIVEGIRELIEGSGKKIYVAITHTDSDHYNLLDSILFDGTNDDPQPVTKIVNVFLGGKPQNVNTQAGYFKALGQAPKLKKFLGSNTTLVADTFDPQCGNDVIFHELANNTNTISSNSGVQKNAPGLVAAVTFKKITTILSADATGETEEAVLKKLAILPDDNIRILTMSHHGSNTNESNTLLPAGYRPEIFVVSGKPTGGERFPSVEAVERTQAYTQDINTMKLSGSANPLTAGKRKRGVAETVSMSQGVGSPVLSTGDYGSMWFYCGLFSGKLEVGCTRDQCPAFSKSRQCGDIKRRRIHTRSQGPVSVLEK